MLCGRRDMSERLAPRSLASTYYLLRPPGPLFMQFRTRAIHVGQQPDPHTGAVVPPIYMATSFVQPTASCSTEFDYSRSGNPTRKAFETTLAALEEGSLALAFASGMAATHCVMMLLGAGRSRGGERGSVRRHVSAAAQDPRSHRRARLDRADDRSGSRRAQRSPRRRSCCGSKRRATR